MIKKLPCTIDLNEPREIILRFRDLINVGRLLDIDLNKAHSEFIHKLKTAGWSDERIHFFIECACNWTIWEQEIPSKIRSKGNLTQFYENNGRFR